MSTDGFLTKQVSPILDKTNYTKTLPVGSCQFRIRAITSNLLSATLTVNVVPEDGRPTGNVHVNGNIVRFSINGTTYDGTANLSSGIFTLTKSGDYSFLPIQDFNGNVNVLVTSSNGVLESTTPLMIVITKVNDAPNIITRTATVKENTTFVTKVDAVDVESDNLTFSIVGGADQGLFTINETTGDLSFKVAPDHENPSDADKNNEYNVMIQVADTEGATATQTLTVIVEDVAEGPVITSPTTADVTENTTVVHPIIATSPSNRPLTYSVAQENDGALFTIDQDTKVLLFKSSPDFENLDGKKVFLVTIQVDDGVFMTTQTITVTVTNANEPPSITSPSTVSMPDNDTQVLKVLASDKDANTILNYIIYGGVDMNAFTLDSSTGDLRFKVAPNHATPHDADGDNTYSVKVKVSDQYGSSTTQDIDVTIFPRSITHDEETDATGRILVNTVSPYPLTFSVDNVEYSLDTTVTIQGKGSLRVNGDGTFKFTPLANYHGLVTILAISGNEVVAFTITTRPVNDPLLLRPFP